MRNLLLVLMLISLPSVAFAQKESKMVKEGNKNYLAQRFAMAQKDYENGLQKNDSSFSASFNLGNSLYRQGKYEEAFKRYSESAGYSKDKDNTAATWHNAGNSMFEQKQYQNSIDAYKRALKENPKDNQTRYNLAVAQYMLKQQQQKEQQKKDDKQQDKDKQQQQQQQQQQQSRPQQQKITKEQSEQILQALLQDEKNTQDKRKIKFGQKSRAEKEW